MNIYEKGEAIAAIETTGGRITEAQAVEIANILGDVASFRYFDGLAGSGSYLADQYHCWKVRQARNMNIDGRPVFFDALMAATVIGVVDDVVARRLA